MRRILCLAVVLCFLAPATAHAHLMNTGLGPFYDGLAHLFVSPEDLLPVLAIALLAGLRGPKSGRVVLFILPATWLLGATVGQSITTSHSFSAPSAVITFALGALVAADIATPLPLLIALAGLLGLLHGGLNGAEFAHQHLSPFIPMGIAAAIFVVVSLLAGQVTIVQATWARIAVRVAGSWIAAIAMLMFGWSMRA